MMVENRARNWIDLDENVLDGYLLIDDRCLEPSIVPSETDEFPYPEGAIEIDDDDDSADSYGRPDSMMYDGSEAGFARRFPEDFDHSMTYPLANSHRNTCKESGSHNNYADLYSEIGLKSYLETNRDDVGDYSIANSHGDHSAISTENRDRQPGKTEDIGQMNWHTISHPNYQVANSHSNYRVFYDSQGQHGWQHGRQHGRQATDWQLEPWEQCIFPDPNAMRNDIKQEETTSSGNDETEGLQSPRVETKAESERGAESTCDIEQCLVQIEESLLNIEQNLLHVQDLDIPELRSLLYKSPSIERSLFEVQDLLYADGITPVINRTKSVYLESDDEEEIEEEDEEEVWEGQNLIIKENDDEDGDGDGDAGGGALDASYEESSNTANLEENPSRSINDSTSMDCMDTSNVHSEEVRSSNYVIGAGKAMNFIPNSLGKTLPRRILLDETKENIRLSSSEPEEHRNIDYNLNNAFAEEKLSCRDKCRSRTNSLDENPSVKNASSIDRHETGKTSLQNLFYRSTSNSLGTSSKTKSEDTLLDTFEKANREKRSSDEVGRSALETKSAEGLRKKIEFIASHRGPNILRSGLTEHSVSRSREKSPPNSRRTVISNEKPQEKDKESTGNKGYEKRKRRKASSRGQSSSENALVPSKLISLSLSLLLAALLQAVRCLTDLVEDAFRSVSYDRNGLLQ